MNKIDNIEPELTSVANAAKLLNVHPNTVRNNIPLVQIGRRKLVRISDIKEKAAGSRLFAGDGIKMLLSYMFQRSEGSPHTYGSPQWNEFGNALVLEFSQHIAETGLSRSITKLEDVVAWQQTPDAAAFFDKHIPASARGRRTNVWTA
jgi:hypothetical protein